MSDNRKRAFEFAAQQPWAITENSLSLILDIAARVHEPDFAAVAQAPVRGDSSVELRARPGQLARTMRMALRAGTVTLRREANELPASVPFGDALLKPLRGGETLAWKQA